LASTLRVDQARPNQFQAVEESGDLRW